MINSFFICTVFLCMHACMIPKTEYPETIKSDAVETFFGSLVEDPCRWLEDEHSDETKKWIKDQNEVTFNYLKTLPGREIIKKRLTEIMDFPKSGVPFTISGRWFVFNNKGLQNQSILYTMKEPGMEETVLLDPNGLSDDGTIAYSGMDVSPDGKYLVYKIARSGSDWNEIFVKKIE